MEYHSYLITFYTYFIWTREIQDLQDHKDPEEHG